MKKGRCLIGTSGWYYQHWYGRFYPDGLSKSELFEYFARSFDTVELNNTFYHLPKESVVKDWRKKAPDGFVFSVKASRFITHVKRLANLGDSLQIFLKRAYLLKEKLGPLLYQLPPSMKKDTKRLTNFLKKLPRKRRNVIEFRNESWLDEEVFEILEKFNAAHCIISMPGFPQVVRRTADFAYIRMHGGSTLYRSNYSTKELKECAGWVKRFLKEGCDTYVYFNNDAYGYAVKNALALKKML
ncbi:MAG: DUF72 domain-containing protein [Candidatus Omnitrophota bacterium]|nr:MAG: DUF72 domain-containing protein [Candidatus Omnitrophota bacterium]